MLWPRIAAGPLLGMRAPLQRTGTQAVVARARLCCTDVRSRNEGRQYGCRSVEQLRSNWAAIRRGETGFRNPSDHEDLDDIPLAARMAHLSRKRDEPEEDAEEDIPLRMRLAHQRAKDTLQRAKRQREMQGANAP